MKKKLLYIFPCALLLFVLSYNVLYSWGFFAHKRINRIAVFTLPPNMIGFYKHHIEFITEHAVDPDKRRYAIEGEAERHFIDVDRYYKYGDNPFEIIPKYWKDAVAKFSEDTLRANGIVPWHIDVMVRRLTDAFREENVNKILRTSADIGHYIGDAHVPLHTTENYNGQLTNQKGIHGFWESRLPELYGDDYNYFVGKAKYIEDPLETAWNIVKASFSAKDSVLLFEAELNESFPKDKKYSFENRGASLMKVYSAEYSKAYDEKLNGMVERRMRETIIMVGSYWYTAWVNAGQPDLKRLLDKKTTDELKKQLAEEEEMWKTGKVKTTKEHE
ncbi:MAG: zinc dependent phospholipase C family protein [Bacteroidota bacterium]|nr:zinc dependent phospholipase C family protein [Bacteroidota bacterium]